MISQLVCLLAIASVDGERSNASNKKEQSFLGLSESMKEGKATGGGFNGQLDGFKRYLANRALFHVNTPQMDKEEFLNFLISNTYNFPAPINPNQFERLKKAFKDYCIKYLPPHTEVTNKVKGFFEKINNNIEDQIKEIIKFKQVPKEEKVEQSLEDLILILEDPIKGVENILETLKNSDRPYSSNIGGPRSMNVVKDALLDMLDKLFDHPANKKESELKGSVPLLSQNNWPTVFDQILYSEKNLKLEQAILGAKLETGTEDLLKLSNVKLVRCPEDYEQKDKTDRQMSIMYLDIRASQNLDIGGCKQICLDNTGCEGFIFNRRNGGCILLKEEEAINGGGIHAPEEDELMCLKGEEARLAEEKKKADLAARLAEEKKKADLAAREADKRKLAAVKKQVDASIEAGKKPQGNEPQGYECVQERPECETTAYVWKDDKGKYHTAQVLIPDTCFEGNPKPIGGAGGTAAFYHLKLEKSVVDKCKVGVNAFIGKVLTRAIYERDFYIKIFSAKKDQNTEFEKIKPFLPSFLGVYQPKKGEGQPGEALLVIQNMFHDMVEALLLDIKIGEVTAEKGWMGKGDDIRKNEFVDQSSTSKEFGFRLEGMSSTSTQGEGVKQFLARIPNKFEKFYMQRAPFEKWWCAVVKDFANEDLTNQIAEKLKEYVVALEAITIPQKWIGSSIGIVIGANGKLLLQAFDFGRSQLTTKNEWEQFEAEEKENRNLWWKRYKNGISNLLEKFKHFSVPSIKDNCPSATYGKDPEKKSMQDFKKIVGRVLKRRTMIEC